MPTLTKKAMILFDPEQYRKLEQEARRRKSSVGQLVREAVEKFILASDKVSRYERIKAAERIVSAQEEVPEWEEIEKLIARGHTKW